MRNYYYEYDIIHEFNIGVKISDFLKEKSILGWDLICVFEQKYFFRKKVEL